VNADAIPTVIIAVEKDRIVMMAMAVLCINDNRVVVSLDKLESAK